VAEKLRAVGAAPPERSRKSIAMPWSRLSSRAIRDLQEEISKGGVPGFDTEIVDVEKPTLLCRGVEWLDLGPASLLMVFWPADGLLGVRVLSVFQVLSMVWMPRLVSRDAQVCASDSFVGCNLRMYRHRSQLYAWG
jgi:hypothetical protein